LAPQRYAAGGVQDDDGGGHPFTSIRAGPGSVCRL
jgi:hypothetical protein